ncbi:nicotinate phosphoribosyltransferase [Bacillus phage vB_BauM_KLEB27-3]|nr:nicotinate phosphoribosyltransferase [Bacillus phage vB_BauM_KLEB27-3]
MNNTPATLLCDFYKVSHKNQYPEKTQRIYSTFVPRTNKYFPQANHVVVFGIQYFIKNILLDYFNKEFFSRSKEEVAQEYEDFIRHTLGDQHVDSEHIAALHDLGYLPIKISALKEGTLAPIKVPVLTVENTVDDFFWITNYLETIMSNEIWLPMTSATISNMYRDLLEDFAHRTGADLAELDFQAHDFSMRGMSSFSSSEVSGAAHLLSFTGTDTIPAIFFHQKYYNADYKKELIGASIPATEHSVMSANTDPESRDELAAFKRLITEVYPSGLASIVSDTYDFWKVVDEILPALKDDIMNRDGKIVIRPDSGDPADILCGIYIPSYDSIEEAIQDLKEDVNTLASEKTGEHSTGEDVYSMPFKVDQTYYKAIFEVGYNRTQKKFYFIDEIDHISTVEFSPSSKDLGLIESLWNIFGGTINKRGYKVLDSHIGAIYGDSITLERAADILARLKQKGFVSTSVVFGVGSFSFQYQTRDTLGFAMKATYAVIDGQEKKLFKDPKTDDGTKRSHRGMVSVIEDKNANMICIDDLDQKGKQELSDQELLRPVFLDGKLLVDDSLSNVREKLKEQRFKLSLKGHIYI